MSGHVFVYNGYRLYIFVRFFLLEFGCVPIVCYFLKYFFHFINKAKKYKSNTGTTYPSGAHEFTTGFQWGSCCSLYNVCGSSIYGFWLLHWYFLTLHSYPLYRLWLASFQRVFNLNIWWRWLGYPKFSKAKMATKIKNFKKSNLGFYSNVRSEKYALYLWVIYQDFKGNLSYKSWCYYRKYINLMWDISYLFQIWYPFRYLTLPINLIHVVHVP